MAMSFSSGSGGSNVGGNMNIVGQIVGIVGAAAEMYHIRKQYAAQIEQNRYDTANEWMTIQRQAKSIGNDRIYNAAAERARNRIIEGETEARAGRSGLRGRTLELQKATQKSILEADVQERSRQASEQIKLLQYEQRMLLYRAANQRRALRQQGQQEMQVAAANTSERIFNLVGTMQDNKQQTGSFSGSVGKK